MENVTKFEYNSFGKTLVLERKDSSIISYEKESGTPLLERSLDEFKEWVSILPMDDLKKFLLLKMI